jgi:hypothetical protein
VSDLVDSEADPDRKLKLRRFQRGLKAAHGDVSHFRDILALFEDAPEEDHEAIIAGNRSAFTPDFFEFLRHVVAASSEDKARQQELVSLVARIGALNTTFQRAEVDDAALDAAAGKFHSLLQVSPQFVVFSCLRQVASGAGARSQMRSMPSQGSLLCDVHYFFVCVNQEMQGRSLGTSANHWQQPLHVC